MIRTFALAAALTLSAPAAAQDVPPEARDAARQAQEIATLMADVQGATALAQRQYFGMVGGAPGESFQGAIALPSGEEGVWRAVIVGQSGEGAEAVQYALAEYEIADGAIRSETIHLPGDTPPLSGSESALAQARGFAPRAVIAAGGTFCTGEEESESPSVTFATIVLPPRPDGTFDAYVLNGPIEANAIPLGRHYRVGFDQFGLDGEPELVTDTCEVISWSGAEPNPATTYATAHDGAAPTPVHVFLSTLLPFGLAVTTGDVTWPVADGAIAEPQAPANPAPAG
ncbi:hypothetical protein [Aurantiacibacter aquimixticola]|uniref:Uncharacterized protein n=1 Tax=Aurantiacibacter aquimixticola TaxID=1958945 RepID=A0A419RT41_9SPHN|nr:hypothetical protein [Aurantiacibacter aquimixticola]RJY08948.1 hypothetical protein D6201_05845 [Aurantiacibacter aquimixticola]